MAALPAFSADQAVRHGVWMADEIASAPAAVVSTGHAAGFRAARGAVAQVRAGVAINAALADVLGVSIGSEVRHVAF